MTDDAGSSVALGAMPIEEAVERLALIDEEAALDFENGDPPYKHTSHMWGFIPQVKPVSGNITIHHPGSIAADTSLKGQRINISINLIAVAKYPGRGIHNILFEFKAENQIAGTKEPALFSGRYRVSSGGTAGVINAPIFVGLSVGNNMMKFECKTVNVENEDDRRFIDFLESDVMKDGLRLASTVQPAIAPLSAMVSGITKSILNARKNVTVQEITMGLDFGGPPLGARLALGDYIAVQVPPDALANWDWSEWIFRPTNGQIVSASDPAKRIPFNYIFFGVSKFVP